MIVGTYPSARYFSVTDDDAHYTATQHLADKDIDPGVSGMTNPFVVSGGSSPPYDGTQYYAVPVSPGTVPDVSNGCKVSPFEEDTFSVRHNGIIRWTGTRTLTTAAALTSPQA